LIPDELYEAADVDGASKWSQFRSITLPLLKPTLAVALVFRTLDALRVFDLFQIVFAQRKYSMASFAYYQLIDSQRLGYSSAASVIIFFIITIFAIFYIRSLGLAADE
jgi:trehalose/maltose transport system permease protein